MVVTDQCTACPVPSIAQEYIRNRQKHDREARRWTELYARPPASTLTSNGKGKEKALSDKSATPLEDEVPSRQGTSTPTSVTAARSRNGSAHPETIVLDGADETSTSARKRKRGGVPPPGGVVDVDLSTEDDDDEGAARAAARRKRRAEASRSRVPTPADEVIVIED